MANNYFREQYGGEFNVVGAIDINKYAIETYKHNLFHGHEDLCRVADITELSADEFDGLIKQYEDLGNIDIIIGGPPCPGFSNIGRSKIMDLVKTGKWDLSEERHAFIDDPRNELFFEYVKYVDHFAPDFFIFENVKGLTSHKRRSNGKTEAVIDVIKQEFDLIGYNTLSKVINSADYGVPQKRERYFIVGQKSKMSDGKMNFEFPSPTHQPSKLHKPNYDTTSVSSDQEYSQYLHINTIQALLDLPELIDEDSSSVSYTNEITGERTALKPPYNVVWEPKDRSYHYRFQEISAATEYYKEKYHHERHYPISEKQLESMRNYLNYIRSDHLENESKYPVNCHYPRRISKKNTGEDIAIFRKLRTEPYAINGNKKRKVVYKDLPDHLKRYGQKGFGDKMRRLPWWKPSWTIMAHLSYDGYMFIHPDKRQNRSITVREAARLQSFPDSFDFSANGKVSMTQQFKQVGNAVPPLVAKVLGKALIEAIIASDGEIKQIAPIK